MRDMLALARDSGVPRNSVTSRITAAATGLSVGTAIGLMLWEVDLASIAAAPILALVLLGLVRLLVPREHQLRVAALVGLSFTLRIAAAAVLREGSLALGRGGFISGDDSDYATLAWAFVRYLAGVPEPPWVPPFWNGNTYLFGTFVYLESGVFALFGPNVLLVESLNAAFGTAAVVLLYDVARRLVHAGAALAVAALVALYPSLVLWSALNLKDGLTLLLISSVLWLLLRFQERQSWWRLLGAYALLLPLESLRSYVFVGLAIVIPSAVAVAPQRSLRRRVTWAVVAVLLSLAVSGAKQTGAADTVVAQVVARPLNTLEAFEYIRHSMAVGARTAYQDPPPLRAREGDTFVVRSTSSSPQPQTTPATLPPVATSATAQPAASPSIARVVNVPPDAEIVVVTPGQPSPRASPTSVYVQPGDVVVVGAPGTTPAPPEERRVLVEPALRPGGIRIAGDRPWDIVVRTAAYLPKGLAYGLFAPFPWDLSRALDLLTLPEMLFWYLVVACVPWSVWSLRRRWPYLLPLLLYVLGMTAVLSLAEGNWGTLFRHRSMIIPFGIVLASPSLLAVARAIALRSRMSPRR